MIKFNKVLLTQDEIELLSELLVLEEQDRNPMFENIIDDEKEDEAYGWRCRRIQQGS